jgi:hypothetical protein
MARKIYRETITVRIPRSADPAIARQVVAAMLGEKLPRALPAPRQPNRIADIDMNELFPEGQPVTFNSEGGFRYGS